MHRKAAAQAAASSASLLVLLLCLASAPILAQEAADSEEPEVAMRSTPVCSVYHPSDCW